VGITSLIGSAIAILSPLPFTITSSRIVDDGDKSTFALAIGLPFLLQDAIV
jgi:hypothetical protein